LTADQAPPGALGSAVGSGATWFKPPDGKCWKVTPPYQPKIGGAAGGGGAGGEAPGASSNEWKCGNVPVQSDVLGKICRKLWFYMVLQLYPRNPIK